MRAAAGAARGGAWLARGPRRCERVPDHWLRRRSPWRASPLDADSERRTTRGLRAPSRLWLGQCEQHRAHGPAGASFPAFGPSFGGMREAGDGAPSAGPPLTRGRVKSGSRKHTASIENHDEASEADFFRVRVSIGRRPPPTPRPHERLGDTNGCRAPAAPH